MRILETCIAAWPVPEMQPRIDAFKEAFSADSSRPFELKRSFPYGSPSSSGTFQPSPSPDGHMNHPILVHHDSHMQSTQLSYHAQPITPPVSAGFDTSKENSISSASMPLMPTAQQHHLPLQTSSIDVGWNPAPIFRCVSARRLRYEKNPDTTTVLGTLRLDCQPPSWLQLQPLCLSNHRLPCFLLHHSHQRYLHCKHINRTLNNLILCLLICHLSLESRPHHNSLLMQAQCLRSSPQACGATLLLARTTRVS